MDGDQIAIQKMLPFTRDIHCSIQWIPFESPPPVERPLDNVNLKINVLIFIPDERPPLLKGHFSDAKGVASQEGFHCTTKHITLLFIVQSLHRNPANILI